MNGTDDQLEPDRYNLLVQMVGIQIRSPQRRAQSSSFHRRFV